jgi:uncharacterized protein YdaU (DUF1376 family)
VSDASKSHCDTSERMGETSPAFQFYPRDFIMSTHGMTDEQVGAYIRLLSFSWDRCGLPADDTELRELGYWSPEQWARIWPKVGPKWKRKGDRLFNERQERERAAQKSRADAAKEAGKRGAERRWSQTDRRGGYSDPNSHPNATAMRIDSTASAFASAKETTTPPVPVTRESSSVVAFDPTAYSSGQLRATISGLVGAWNNVAAVHPPLVAVSPGVTSSGLSRALAAHPDISWWADVFRSVAESDYLMGRDGKNPPITFWKVIDKADEIAGGKYRSTKPPATDEYRPPLGDHKASKAKRDAELAAGGGVVSPEEAAKMFAAVKKAAK